MGKWVRSKVTVVKDRGGASNAAHKSSVYLCVLEQNGGVEAGVGLGDVEPTVVGHFLLQGAHERWRRRRRTLNFTRPGLKIIHSVIQLTMYQLFFFADVWKQLLECFFVLYEALKRDGTAKNSDSGIRISHSCSRCPEGGGEEDSRYLCRRPRPSRSL